MPGPYGQVNPPNQVNYGNPAGTYTPATPAQATAIANANPQEGTAGLDQVATTGAANGPTSKLDARTGTAYGVGYGQLNTAANPYNVNDPDYEYGGYSAGQQQYDAQYQAQANAAEQRQAPTINYGGATAQAIAAAHSEEGAQSSIGAQQQNIGNYGQLYGQLMAESKGQGPNPAALASQQATQQGIQAQMAMANSTRGSAGAGLAQLGAQQQGAQLQQANAQNTGIQTAQQQLAAQQQAAGVLGAQQSALQGVTGAQQAQTGQFQQGESQQAQMAQAQGTLGMQQQQANDALSTYYQSALANVNTEQLQANEAASGQANQIGIAQAPLNQATIGGIASAAGSAASMASDARLKADIRPAGKPYGQMADPGNREEIAERDVPRGYPNLPEHTPTDGFLDTLDPFSYRYADPRDEPTTHPTGGHYLGVLAQNVERGPTGSTIVQEGPHGKELQTAPMVSALAAAAGRLHQRVGDLEKRAYGDITPKGAV